MAHLPTHVSRNSPHPYAAGTPTLWGGWWVVLAVFFSTGRYLNSYYLAALTPAVAALCGVGVSLCGPPPWSARVRLTMLATSAVCLAYGLYLLPGGAVVPAWVVPTAVAVFAIAAGLLLLAPWLEGLGTRGRLLIPVAACVALIALPASASASSVARGLGPFDTPFESLQTSAATQSFAAKWARLTMFMQLTGQQQRGPRILFGTDTSGSTGALDRGELHTVPAHKPAPADPVRLLPLLAAGMVLSRSLDEDEPVALRSRQAHPSSQAGPAEAGGAEKRWIGGRSQAILRRVPSALGHCLVGTVRRGDRSLDTFARRKARTARAACAVPGGGDSVSCRASGQPA